uniref:Uncharacterized protein n=1 Tax=Micrurus corallinus TaxID=54390 RepID=A0A2D4ELX3_MICCO
MAWAPLNEVTSSLTQISVTPHENIPKHSLLKSLVRLNSSFPIPATRMKGQMEASILNASLYMIWSCLKNLCPEWEMEKCKNSIFGHLIRFVGAPLLTNKGCCPF